jgi:pyruvate,water dikinase
MDLPDFAERAAKTGIKYVGLQRLEGIIATSGKHPLAYEQEKDFEGYQLLLQKGIDRIAERFDNIWIRSSDIRSDEFSTLKGAPEKELNPMLGFHGIRFSLKHPQLFEAELKALERVLKISIKLFGVFLIFCGKFSSKMH